MIRKLGVVGVIVAVMMMVACSTNVGPEDEGLTSAEETGQAADELTAGVPIGSTLATTAGLNLRTGPATSNSVLKVIPNGAKVVTVNRTTPVNGFYNIKHDGIVGWSHGGYLKLVSSAGGGGGGGGGGGATGARGEAIARAKEGVGFSYWWGHGRWLSSGPTSSNKGTCSGSCPSCSHSGAYGADCSGYVAKIWQVPSSNTNVATDSHPYSTVNFATQSIAWTTVSRGAVKVADALTYNSNGAGHIFLYESGDGWGSMWAYEAKGCSAGIVHNLRTASSAYKAIARNGW